MTMEIEKYLIKVELNSSSYITGEFLCKTQFQLQLLNSMYANEEKVILPNVTLNTCDIRSVSKLNETERLSYINIVSSKNMLVLPGSCCKCNKPKEVQVDECAGIKSIEEGFDSTLESSSDVSGLSLSLDKESVAKLVSSEEESSSVSLEEELQEAFKRKLALRNAMAQSKVEKKQEVKHSPSTPPKEQSPIKPQTIPYLTPHNTKNDPAGKKWMKGTAEGDNNRHFKRKEIQSKSRDNYDRDGYKKRIYSKTDQNKSNPKERIVYGWKQKKYNDGHEIIKGVSSKFTNSSLPQGGWTEAVSWGTSSNGNRKNKPGSRW